MYCHGFSQLVMNRSTANSTAYQPTTGVGEEHAPFLRRVRARAILLVGKIVASWRKIEFEGSKLDYVVEPYNLTCANERCLELGLIQGLLPDGGRVLEIGNVWGHYREHAFEVVDKYEISPGVQNIDIVDLPEDQKFDFIFSISTFEHVGWDEEPRQPEKLCEALEKLPRLLNPGGSVVVTVPISWNSWLDEQLASGSLPADRIDWFVRKGLFCNWTQSTREETLARGYGQPHPGANGVAVIRFDG